MKRATTTWQRIKEFPPLIASSVAILAAIVGVVTWVAGYFATRDYANEIRCWAQINNSLNSRQIDQALLLGERYDKKLEIRRLEGDGRQGSEPLHKYEQDSLERARKDYEVLTAKIEAKKTAAAKLTAIIRSRDVYDRAGGKCRGADIEGGI